MSIKENRTINLLKMKLNTNVDICKKMIKFGHKLNIFRKIIKKDIFFHSGVYARNLKVNIVSPQRSTAFLTPILTLTLTAFLIG